MDLLLCFLSFVHVVFFPHVPGHFFIACFISNLKFAKLIIKEI